MAAKLFFLIYAIAPLICDAQVNFQTRYISLGSQDTSVAISADASGNIFIVSSTNNAIRATKTDPNGNVLAVLDFGQGVIPAAAAVDAQGNLLVVGNSFIAKVDNALANVLATTSFPAAAIANANAVTTDAAGNVYVAGTAGASFPTTPGAYQINPPQGAGYAFIAEFPPDLSTIISATLFGSSVADCSGDYDTCRGPNGPGLFAATTATAMVIDPSGSVVIAGYTSGIPAPLSVEPYNYGFVAKFTADLASLEAEAVFNPVGTPISETYFRAMALDPQGNLLLVGDANNVGPLTGSNLQPTAPDDQNGFVLKMDGALQTFLWGTYFGGGVVQGVAVDAQSNIWITGVSQQSELPNTTSTSIAILPFVAELTPDGSSILNMFSSQFGGAAVTILPNGGAAVLGLTDSFLLPASPDQPALLMVANSANSQSSGTIAPAELISLYGTGIGPQSAVGGQVVNGVFTNNLGGYQVLFNGVPAPLLYAGPNQFNVVSPAAIAGQPTVDIEVVGPLGTTAFPTVFVGAARPQLFSQQLPYTIPFAVNPPPELETFAIAYNQDDTLNSVSNPAPRGSIVTIWATGTGLPADPWPDGAIVGSGSAVNLPITMSYGGEAVQVEYAGQAPGAVLGLTQINFLVPSDAIGIGRPFLYSVAFQLSGASTGIAVIEVSTN